MISEFDLFLQEIYNELREELKDLDIELTDCERLFLLLVFKKDSLFNCLIKPKESLELLDWIHLIKEKNRNNSYDLEYLKTLIIKKAKEIAIKDDLVYINDEHLFFAMMNVLDINKNIFMSLLNDLGFDIEVIINELDDYFEFDNLNFLTNISLKAQNQELDIVYGYDEYIDRMYRILMKKKRGNCLIIGSAGVGKSSLVDGLANLFIKKGINTNIYRLELAEVISGTRYRGDLEERIVNAFEKIKESSAILFIDEIHTIVNSSSKEDSISISNILKPKLSSGEIRLIGTTTQKEYYEHIITDLALVRRFENIYVKEPSKEFSYQLLKSVKSDYEIYYNIIFKNPVLKTIIEYSDVFKMKNYPDKAIDLLDSIGSYCKINSKTTITNTIIKKVTFDMLGVNIEKIVNKKNINYYQLYDYYKRFIDLKNYHNILNISISDKDSNNLILKNIIKDLTYLFEISKESIIDIDLEEFNDYNFDVFNKYLVNGVIKNQIVVFIIDNYSKATKRIQNFIKKMIQKNGFIDQNSNIIYTNNTIMIFKSVESFKIGYTNNLVFNQSDLNEVIDIYL